MTDEKLPVWITADQLIQQFGDQAYFKGVRMAVEILKHCEPGPDTVKASRDVTAACLELIRRGYHKRGLPS